MARHSNQTPRLQINECVAAALMQKRKLPAAASHIYHDAEKERSSAMKPCLSRFDL